MSRNLLGLVISMLVVVTAPPLGLLTATLLLGGAFRGSARTDPSAKARVLADGISEAMNCEALGLVVSVVALLLAIVFTARLVREHRRRNAKGGARDEAA